MQMDKKWAIRLAWMIGGMCSCSDFNERSRAHRNDADVSGMRMLGARGRSTSPIRNREHRSGQPASGRIRRSTDRARSGACIGRTEPTRMKDPATIPGLHFTSNLMWWDMPGHPLPCTLCGKPQVWWLSVDRFRAIRTPTTDPPPGWGLCVCGYCGGLLALVLRPWPNMPKPPFLMEIKAMMLRHTAVQYRLEDDSNSREPRWSSAIVTRQKAGGALDLHVSLHQIDPEYRDQMLKSVQTVQYRLEDGEDGQPRWRTALVADQPHPDGALDLTVHFSHEDQKMTGRAFQRISGVSNGEKRSMEIWSHCLFGHTQYFRRQTWNGC